MMRRAETIKVVSVPHTGTHFTMAYLDFIGVPANMRHVPHKHIPYWRKEALCDIAVIPIRNPMDCYESHIKRGASHEGLKEGLTHSFKGLRWVMNNYPHVTLQVDGNLDVELQKVADYFDEGACLDTFNRRPRRSCLATATGGEAMAEVAKEWGYD